MKKSYLFALSLLFTSAAFAGATEYKVEGMSCGSCAKAIEAQVCKIEGLETCEVTVGQIKISTKAGVAVSREQVEAAMSKAGPYKIVDSTTKNYGF